MGSYVPIYHEASCINLLECCMFHRTSCEAAEDAVIDLMDYCYRKLVYLVSVPNRDLYTRVLDAKDCAAQTDLEILEGQVLDLEFQIGMCVISVTRFLTDHRAGLPLSATVRLLETQEWLLVDEEDMGKLPELQVQLFLAVHNLVMDQDCRNRYNLTSVRKDNLLRLRRFLNEVVLDQVPPLANLLRTLEELSITGQYTGAEEAHTPFVVELIAEMRERLVQTYEGRYAAIAEDQKAK